MSHFKMKKMKSKLTVKYIGLMSILLICACNSIFYQETYFVNSPNVNCFDDEKEKNLKLTASFHQFELQSNLALTDKFGVAATLFTGGGNPIDFGGELGGIYYKKLTDYFYFQTQIGYGYFDITNKRDIMPLFIVAHKSWLREEIDDNYHKIYFQPDFFFTTDKFNIGLSAKFNWVYFSDYYYKMETETENDYGVSYGNDFSLSIADFHNKRFFVIEPSLMLKLKNGIYFQLTSAFSKPTFTSDVYDKLGSLPYRLTTTKLHHPMHTQFVFNIGFEFKLGRKKK